MPASRIERRSESLAPENTPPACGRKPAKAAAEGQQESRWRRPSPRAKRASPLRADREKHVARAETQPPPGRAWTSAATSATLEAQENAKKTKSSEFKPSHASLRTRCAASKFCIPLHAIDTAWPDNRNPQQLPPSCPEGECRKNTGGQCAARGQNWRAPWSKPARGRGPGARPLQRCTGCGPWAHLVSARER